MDDKYQLRGQDERGQDTGAISYAATLDDAFQQFLTGQFWKLSFVLPNGRRVRLLMDEEGRTINVTYSDEVMRPSVVPSP